MKKQHRVYKYFSLLTICVLVISLLLPGCGGGAVVEEEEEVAEEEEIVTHEEEEGEGEEDVIAPEGEEAEAVEEEEEEEPAEPDEPEQPSEEPDEPEISVPFIQTTVGSQINSCSESGCNAAWGPNTIKIASYENNVFTYVMDCSVSPWQVSLYSKESGGIWQKGESISLGNPPNILVDSQGFVHLIGHKPFADDRTQGQLFHIEFNESNTVSGSYTLEYITPDTRTTSWSLNNVSSLYNGAAIGEDGTILVAYQASMSYPSPPHAILARIYDPITEEWSYESVATNLSTRFCYPFAAVSENYFHIIAVEDEADETLPSPWRFGIVKHFQRARDSNEWVESTLVDFTDEINANPEVNDLLWMRNMDLFVDSKDIVHVMIRYNEEWEPNQNFRTAYHYCKAESDTEWQLEQVLDEQCYWLKLWEREDGQLFYVYSNFNQQIDVIPFGTNQHYTVSNLNSPYNTDPVPYIANPRSGTNPSSMLNLVIFSGTEETEAIAISCDVSGF